MKLKKLLLAALVAGSAVAFIACGEAETKDVKNEKQEEKKELSPMAVMEEYRQATVAKDAARLAELVYIPAEMLKQFEPLGVKNGKDFIEKIMLSDLDEKDIEDAKTSTVVAEEINGNTAIVTMKDPSGESVPMPCIKVDGKWKLDLPTMTK